MSYRAQYVVMIVITIFVQEISSMFSGLYIDNGVDQTLIERDLSTKEKQKFEREVLTMFDFPKRPPRVDRAKIDKVASKFMLDMYKALDSSQNQEQLNEFNVTSKDIQAMRESDAIITLLSQNTEGPITGLRHEKGKRFWFDVTEVPITNTIMSAELRIYQGNVKERFAHYVVSLYQVFSFNGGEEMEIVDIKITTNNNEGWLSFNVTFPIETWIAVPSSNKGFYISIHKHNETEVRSEEIGLTLEEDGKEPFVVVFLKAGPEGQKVKSRVVRDTRRQVNDEDVSYWPNPFQPEPVWTLRSCQMQTLYVNFKDLKWHEWIIAPDGYAAFYCSGICDFPLNAHMNATNHAIVQTLVNLIDPTRVPKACCAPNKLGQMAVLYYLENGNVMMKRFKNMVVKSCGCH